MPVTVGGRYARGKCRGAAYHHAGTKFLSKQVESRFPINARVSVNSSAGNCVAQSFCPLPSPNRTSRYCTSLPLYFTATCGNINDMISAFPMFWCAMLLAVDDAQLREGSQNPWVQSHYPSCASHTNRLDRNFIPSSARKENQPTFPLAYARPTPTPSMPSI